MLVDRRPDPTKLRPCRPPPIPRDSPLFAPDSGQAWVRLALALLIGSIGSVGMWSVVVVLPVVQAEFGATRGAVSLAFTLTMLGFGLGGVATGKITDRFGIVAAVALSIAFLGVAYVLAGLSTTLWQFIAVYFLIGLGNLGDVCAADGGGLALVRTLPRTGGDHCRQRQLCRRHDLAAGGQLGRAALRLAHHPYRAWYFLRA